MLGLEALESPRRRDILAAVQGNPGIHFRELARLSGIPPGTLRHHLNVLQRAHFLVERRHGATVRFFQAETDAEESWVGLVLRRDPALALLQDWLTTNSGSSQATVLAAMRAHGWPRSSTQHRLGRLVKAGLIKTTRGPRTTRYALVPAPDGPTQPQVSNLHAPTADNHQGREPGAWRRDAGSSRVPPMASAPTFLAMASPPSTSPNLEWIWTP